MATAQTGSLEEVNARAVLWYPRTDAERGAVQEQLEKILASPMFRNSRRYPSLLRFTVERAIEGHHEHLKERVVGIEVFGRDPDYDTNADPIVRATAVEIRKRIARYYSQPGRDTELRIDFPPGSYVAEFRESVVSRPGKIPADVAAVIPAPVAADRVPHRSGFPWPRILLLCSIVLTLILSATGAWRWSHPDVLQRFWQPVLHSSGEVALVIPGPLRAAAAPANAAVTSTVAATTRVPQTDRV